MKPKLLIVEDDQEIRTQMKWALTGEFEVLEAEDRPEAMKVLRSARPSITALDLGLPPHPRDAREGFAALDEILTEDPLAKVIVITGNADRPNALKAIARGAYDFFSKPVDLEELKIIIRRALHVASLERENRELERRLEARAFEDLIGSSRRMEEIFATIRKVAATEVPVLVSGESGTGKEVIARVIHRQSTRAAGLFVTINCGAIPENLLESELFGHEKGAFTGAHAQRRGKFEYAGGGTLFLDEIAELPLGLQVKLLRFLQDGSIERVGGRETISVDARVIAATNRDLDEVLRKGEFRDDLYYRLAVVKIPVPPLRDRPEDILLLARAFVDRYARENRRPIKGFTRPAESALTAHPWPGNVRELENRIKRAVIMADQPKLTPADLELEIPPAEARPSTLREAREAVEREMVGQAMTRHGGNVSKAADDLGISRPTLYGLLSKWGYKSDKGSPD